MLITFIFESFSTAFAIFKYKPSKIRTLIILLLMSLAGFQAAEFMVCGTEHFSGMDWARFGYLAKLYIEDIHRYEHHLHFVFLQRRCNYET